MSYSDLEEHLGSGRTIVDVDWLNAVYDVIGGQTAGVAEASKFVMLGTSKEIASIGTIGCGAITTSGVLKLDAADGADAANALLMGVGTSGDPALTAVASKIFMEFRTKSTATSGDSRGFYNRHEIAGIGGGGEAIRAFAKVTAAASTVRGLHISIDLDTAGTVSGFGAGVDAQVMLGGAAYSDNLAAVNLELYGNTGATITGATSFMRCVLNGDATAIADFDDNAYFIEFAGMTAGTGNLIDTNITAITGYASLRVKIPGVGTRYIPITTGS